MYHMFKYYSQIQKDDIKRTKEAEIMFNDEESLREAINQDIFPCIVSIITDRGIIGIGFFQSPEWLISNAHVLPTFQHVMRARLENGRINSELNAKRSFHRLELPL